MSNGYLVAAAADLAAAHEIADGFGLDVIDASSVHDQQTTGAALASAENVGVIISNEAARDAAFVALLSALTTQRQQAQLILVTGDARPAFPSLPAAWPAMAFEEARSRSNELLRRKQAETPPSDDATRAQPLSSPGSAEATPQPSLEPQSPGDADNQAIVGGIQSGALGRLERAITTEEHSAQSLDTDEQRAAAPAAPAQAASPAAVAQTPPDAQPEPPRRPEDLDTLHSHGTEPAQRAAISSPRNDEMPPVEFRHAPSAPTAPAAPADATAFAPSKLRRGTPELVRIVVHQPKDLNEVIKAARKLDPTSEPAPQGMPIGDVAIGAKIGVSLEVRGGACEGALQRRTWLGDPIDFSFAVEADASVKQVVMLARVFINDAQIGVLAFSRNVSGPAKKPHNPGDRARLKRHKRVFLSYSAKDREIVSAIATAYQMAGVEYFWDRASLKSGEEWHPRLRREIDRADLFHLCWSKSAAQSEWVAKEAEHALTRRRKNSGKPEITVQMLDGPPWAPHPPSLDVINFDDFVRAAIVGYARGDGS
jgi:hypothetical protein